MRWLKSLVIVLGFLIVGGVVLLAYGFVKKTQDPDWRLSDLFRDTPRAAAEKTPAPPPAPASVAAANPAPTPTPQPFGDVNLGLDTGCVVTDVAPAGDRAYLTIGPPGPCHRVIVVYIAAGRVLGTIRPGR
jgi:hypothetical protein